MCLHPTHCKMQGTGINFLHLAETLGLWVALACRRHSDHSENHSDMLLLSPATLKTLPLFYVICTLHIDYAARPSP